MHGGRQLAFLSLSLPSAEIKIIYHKLHGISILSGIINTIVKLRQGSGKDRQGMAVKAKGLKA